MSLECKEKVIPCISWPWNGFFGLKVAKLCKINEVIPTVLTMVFSGTERVFPAPKIGIFSQVDSQ